MYLANIGLPSLVAFAVCFFLLRWLLRVSPSFSASLSLSPTSASVVPVTPL